MAADTCRVVLIGRLTRDPELKTAGGSQVLEGRVAWSRREKRGDQWDDVSNFIDVTLGWNNRAEALAKMLVKGSRIAVDGRLRWREYEAKDGSKRQVIDVAADDVQLLDTRAESQQRPAGSDMPVDNPTPTVDDDETIPF